MSRQVESTEAISTLRGSVLLRVTLVIYLARTKEIFVVQRYKRLCMWMCEFLCLLQEEVFLICLSNFLHSHDPCQELLTYGVYSRMQTLYNNKNKQ